jgi:DNA-binding MarR family transcriptional regulator
LQLTPAGSKLVEKAHEALMKSEQTLLQALSTGERAILLEILQKLGQNSR